MSQFYTSLLHWSLDPHPRVTNPEKIQRSSLLSAILLVLLLLGTAILLLVIRVDADDINAPEVRGTIFVMVIVAGMYIANRLGFNRYAVTGVNIPIVFIFTYIAFSSSGKAIFLAFLLIPILLTAIFFPLKWMTIITGSMLILIFVMLSGLNQISSSSPYWALRTTWLFLLLASGLILTFMWHLGNLEKFRQRELKTINAELEREITQLEQFTYTISHDLKSPLVTIKGFLGLLEKDLKEDRVTQTTQDLNRINRAADKMQWPISDLIEFSRTGRLINSLEEVDLRDLVLRAIDNVEGRQDISRIRINIADDLPVIYCDRGRLIQVLEQLIDNAVKYMGDQPVPLIEIGWREDHCIFVKEYGIGIDPKYHSVVFGLLGKLDPSSEGTGAGLALVKQIVEIHGGKIWVESDGLNRGSTFCFTCPGIRK